MGEFMAAIEVGRVCYKTTGRNATKKVVILETGNGNTVTIIGKGLKKQKCNIRHLFPTREKIDTSGKEEEIIKRLEG